MVNIWLSILSLFHEHILPSCFSNWGSELLSAKNKALALPQSEGALCLVAWVLEVMNYFQPNVRPQPGNTRGVHSALTLGSWMLWIPLSQMQGPSAAILQRCTLPSHLGFRGSELLLAKCKFPVMPHSRGKLYLATWIQETLNSKNSGIRPHHHTPVVCSC